MAVEDIPAVAAIEGRSFPIPWSEEALYGELSAGHAARYLVLEEGRGESARIVAYGGYWKVLDEAHITNLAVDPEERGRGLGRHLVRSLMGHAAGEGIRRATLEVRVGNVAARRLYESLGFVAVALRKRYYADNGEDAVIMWLEEMDRATEAR
jgi:ribosomal-protein-alanine N-acetyltransferase